LTAGGRAADDRRVIRPLEPLALTPARLGRPWGGGRYGSVGDEPVGELWVSGDDATLPDGRTLAAAGLANAVPLVKVLDVAAQLSVQVHPDDRLARELHGEVAIGKHEAWVVLEATAGAELGLGLTSPGHADDLFAGDEATVAAAIAMQPATVGTVIDVAPGTVHAPAAGVLLYEVQQRSDLTYRVFDWGRSRPLHLIEARRAILADAPISVRPLPAGDGLMDLIPPPAPFRLRLVRPADAAFTLELDRPAVLSLTSGEVLLDGRSIERGGHWLLEAGTATVTGSGEALLADWR
jgi:mannose-6-phosphate isomerase